MRFATIVGVLLALMSGIPAALAYDPLDFLVENWGGKRAGLYDTVTWEKHDLPGLAGPPGGYQVSHSVLPGGGRGFCRLGHLPRSRNSFRHPVMAGRRSITATTARQL
jgi:hypothetical protein